MGYACPVCESTQADAEHLANHLAITASLGREDHREWLAEYAPDWADCGPEELGGIVSEYALEVETEGVTGGGGHDHAPAGRPDVEVETALARQSQGPGRGSLTGEAERALEEARELTRKRHESEGDEKGNRDEDSDE